jgi:hypothetical protein
LREGAAHNVSVPVSAHVEDRQIYEQSQDNSRPNGKWQMVEQKATAVVTTGAKRLR